MRLPLGYLLAAALLPFTGACSRQDVHAAKVELRENWDELKGYAIDRREDVQTALSSTFDELGQKIDTLDDRLRNAKDRADEKTAEVVAELREQRIALGRRLEDLRNASAETWSEIRLEVIESMRAFERSVSDAWNRIVH